MPNYVEHDLYPEYEGDDYKIVLEEFHQFWMNHIENMSETLVPHPPERATINAPIDAWKKANPGKDPFFDGMPNKPKDWFNRGGYNWCCENWGSKWGMNDLKCEEEHEVYTFSTAWSPSIPLYDALAKRFPQIPFKICYFEHGMQFSGEIKYENGKQISHEKVKYFGRRGG